MAAGSLSAGVQVRVGACALPVAHLAPSKGQRQAERSYRYVVVVQLLRSTITTALCCW